MKQNNLRYTHELLTGGMLLSVVGGFLEAHTFILRGGVFCNAQTGNIVFMTIDLFRGNFGKALLYLLPIFAFIVGIIISKTMLERTTEENAIRWEHRLLVIEALLFFCVSFIPLGSGDFIVTIAVSFICSMQYNTFRKTENIAYASVFCTNNLRNATENIHNAVKNKDMTAAKKCVKYLIVIAAFCVGVGLQALLAGLLGQYSLLVCSGIVGSILLADALRARAARRQTAP